MSARTRIFAARALTLAGLTVCSEPNPDYAARADVPDLPTVMV